MNRPWTDKYDHPVPEPFSFPETTLDRIFVSTAASHPDWVALSYNDEDTTYGELNERVTRFAHGLRALGVQRGDRVALLLPTSPVYPLAAVAAHRVGAVIVNIGVMTKGPEFVEIVRATGARVLVTLDVFLPNIHTSLAATGLEHLILHSVSGLEQKLPPLALKPKPLETLLRSQPTCLLRSVAEPGDPAVLQMTSGTSGKPKAVLLTHRNIVANLHQIEAFRPPTTPVNAAVICLLPFFHVFGFTICFQLSVLRGYRMVLVPRFDPLAVVPLIGLLEKYRPVLSLPAVPGLWIALTRHLEAGSPGTRALLADIEMPSCGGAPLPPAVKERYLQLTGRRLHEAYGLSEASSTTHMTPLTKPCPAGSIGIPLPGTDARIVDLEDPERELDPGAVGELAVSGPQVMGGYWQTPEATESTARLQDGWLFTGDLARMDAEGYFFIVDRRDDMIITSGFNVYPSEIEAVLKAHPGVADAAAVGVQDPTRGCTIVARVVLREGESLTEAQVLEHCRARLPDYKVPRRVLIVTEIPKSPVGKPLRRQLRNSADEPGPAAG
ncbi:MAG: AMP-binding protein [Candidatus Geothermincolia bacterium]